MPKFTFKSPDGINHVVTGPEGATQEQAWAILQEQLKVPEVKTEQPATEKPEYAIPGAEDVNYWSWLSSPFQALGQTAVDFLTMVPAGIEQLGTLGKELYSGTSFDDAMQRAEESTKDSWYQAAPAATRGLMTEEGNVVYDKLISAFEYGRDAAGSLGEMMASEENKLGGKHLGQFVFDALPAAIPAIPLRRMMRERAAPADMSRTAAPDAYQVAQSEAARSANALTQKIGTKKSEPTVPIEAIDPEAATPVAKAAGPEVVAASATGVALPASASIERGKYKKGFGGELLDSPFSRLTRNFKDRPEVGLAFRRHEANEHFRKTEYDPMIAEIEKATWEKFSPAEKEKFSYYYVNENWPQIEKFFAAKVGDVPAKQAVKALRDSFDARYKEMERLGIKQEYRPNYAPRVVTDPKLLEKLINDVEISDKLDALERNLLSGKITQPEYALKFNKVVNEGFKRKVVDPHSRHENVRTVGEVTPDFVKAYANPFDSIRQYHRDTGQVIAQRQFLGKGGSIEGSIGELQAKFSADKPLTKAQNKVIEDVVKARFGPEAHAPMRGMLADFKNVGYLGTIGQLTSALTQLGDLAASFARQGLRSTAVGMGKALKPKGRRDSIIDPVRYGMGEPMAELVSQPRKTAKVLDLVLRGTGFKAIDRFGKRTIANAAANKFKRWANKKSGIEKLEKMGYKKLLGKKAFDKFIEDLKTGDTSNPNVVFAVLNEIAEVQPVWMSDMPIAYLRHPQGRIAYSLKTWFIRQLNRYREDIARGDYGKALVYASAIYAGSLSVDLAKKFMISAMRGEDLTQDDVKEFALANLLQTFGAMNKWELDKTNEPLRTIFTSLAPPIVGMGDDVYKDAMKALEGKLEINKSQTLSNLPIAGSGAMQVVK